MKYRKKNKEEWIKEVGRLVVLVGFDKGGEWGERVWLIRRDRERYKQGGCVKWG